MVKITVLGSRKYYDADYGDPSPLLSDDNTGQVKS
jgi:hypothetical protein